MRKGPILALLVAALTLPAFAAEEKAEGHKKEGEKKEGEAKKGKPGTNVDMPFLMAPMTDADGKLTGYAYISTLLIAKSNTIALTVREKLPFIQDAMVRDINNAVVTTQADPQSVDVPGLEKRLLQDAQKVMGADKVKQITVCTVQIAQLRPVQTQAKNGPSELPATDEHKNPLKSRCET